MSQETSKTKLKASKTKDKYPEPEYQKKADEDN